MVKGPAIASLSLQWQGQSLAITTIRIPNPNIDLAVLYLAENLDHDWVMLDEEMTERERLKTFGYPEGYAQGDPATFEYEGMTGDRQLIKFKAGQVQKGFSGSPLVNERTNRVCGVIKKTRDKQLDLGGRAIPVGLVFETFPELKPKVTEIPENPFKPINGIINAPDLFFGRERELRSVFEILNSGSSVAVIGDRR
ncbi:MAG: trypsin-like peptidase domain-containing protein [Limnothrix sp. RL_2_0]|nr:trypsin-like peptidase domain-containing protein [Limnothrix sp. RL_2_0]